MGMGYQRRPTRPKAVRDAEKARRARRRQARELERECQGTLLDPVEGRPPNVVRLDERRRGA